MALSWTGWNRLRYTAYAPFYDAAVAWWPVLRRGRRRAFELAALRPGERVLLVAAGTGLDLDYIPLGVDVVTTDLAPAMVGRLRRRPSARGRRLHALVMDGARLACRDESMDCVVLHLALAVVPDPVATIREAARVLRRGGRVSILDKFLPDHATPSPLRRLASGIARLVATDLNRQLGPLLAAGQLTLRHREPIGFGRLFLVARADKS
jgi:ubiquinone/menaquinone biosynthesis C-methylase UbiE